MASILTQMIRGEVPAWKIAEDEKQIAFIENNPSAYGHLIILPKIEIDSLFDMPTDDYLPLMSFTQKIAHQLKIIVTCDKIGMSVIGLKTRHAHIHLIPLHTMDDILFKNKLEVTEDYFKKLQRQFLDLN